MLDIFKSTDQKLFEYGFNKVEETVLGARYERYDDAFKFLHKVDISRRFNGIYEIESYDATNADFFSPVVALTDVEMKLFNKKIHELKHPW